MAATTITINDITPRRQYTATAGQIVFSFPFPFFEDADLKVYRTPAGNQPNDANDILTLNTDYTVTGADTQNGGDVTLVGIIPSNGDIITIVREIALSRTADYQVAGDLLAETLNREQDGFVMMAQQLQEELDRALKLETTSTGSTAGLLNDLETVADYVNEIDVVATDLVGGTLGTARLYDLGSITNSAGTLSAVPDGYIVTVYDNIADVNTVAADITDVSTVAADIADVSTVATDLAGADNIGTVAADIADVTTVGTNISDVNAVATALTSVPSGASLVTYDNATSGLTSTDVQAALDELVSAAVNAINVAYSNTASGLTATDVQAAIDEINTAVGALPTLSGTNTFSGATTFNANVTINGTVNAGSI